jgi:hypothetical protein
MTASTFSFQHSYRSPIGRVFIDVDYPGYRITRCFDRLDQKAFDGPRSPAVADRPVASWGKAMKNPKRDPVREDRIHNEAIVNARPAEH